MKSEFFTIYIQPYRFCCTIYSQDYNCPVEQPCLMNPRFAELQTQLTHLRVSHLIGWITSSFKQWLNKNRRLEWQGWTDWTFCSLIETCTVISITRSHTLTLVTRTPLLSYCLVSFADDHWLAALAPHISIPMRAVTTCQGKGSMDAARLSWPLFGQQGHKSALSVKKSQNRTC